MTTVDELRRAIAHLEGRTRVVVECEQDRSVALHPLRDPSRWPFHPEWDPGDGQAVLVLRVNERDMGDDDR